MLNYLVVAVIVLFVVLLILKTLNLRTTPKNELWTERGESQSAFTELLSRAKNEIEIVTGNLYPPFYESYEVIAIFRNLLKSGGSIKIVFSKFAKDIDEAVKSLQEENPKLFELLKEYKEQIKLYWPKKRAVQHYAVIDGNHIFAADSTHPSKTYELFRYEDSILGKEWQGKFKEYVSMENMLKVKV